MGKRPPSIIATDLARESAKYKEAHTKANDSNQTLHRAMMAHVANLKILQQPLRQLQQQLPSVELPNCESILIFFLNNFLYLKKQKKLGKTTLCNVEVIS